MADFQGFLCWSPDEAAATINTEAVSPSRAVFLATHTPLRIRKAKLRGGSRSDAKSLDFDDNVVDERHVLEDFLKRKSDTGALLMPVVGDSGAGKSHLVRWAGEHIPEDDTRKVIYLEKGKTSLKAVVKALLADIDTPVGARLRAEIDRFTADLDEPALARRLLNSIEEALSGTTPHNVSGPPRVLRGPNGLAVIFQDPYVRQHMLSPGRFIPQLAHQLLADRRDGEEQRPERFAPADLPLDIDDVQQTAAMTKRLLNTMTVTPGLKDAAVELLNEHLEAAVKQAFNLGAGSLTQAMIDVRREYAARRQEIVLLVEDFALIQGMQRDLLDAIIEPANRLGRAVLASIRTMMAVTTGYFQDLPETVLTRIHATVGYVYDLDLPFSDRDRGGEHIASFVGRYLNAARIGTTGLDVVDHGGEIPNRCGSCDFQAQCHAAFGYTEDGYGLYPFNESALLRAVHSSAPQQNPYRFVPRNILGGVVRQVLVEHADSLSDGRFPSAAFRADYPTASIDQPLGSSVRARVDALDELDSERRNLVLEFWGDAPDAVGAVNETILQAFALAPISEVGEGSPRPSFEDVSPRYISGDEPEPGAQLPRSLVARLTNVEEWVTRGTDLGQDAARDVRTVVSEAVGLRYSWADPLMREMAKKTWQEAWENKAATTSIEGAKGEGASGVENAPIRFKRTASNSQFFQSLLRIKNGHPPVLAEDVYRLAAIAEQNSSAFTKALQAEWRINDDDLVFGFRASILGAALAGRAHPGMGHVELLAAALDEGRDWSRTDGDLRTGTWSRLLETHVKGRPGLVQAIKHAVGVAQGIGQPRLIDAARVLPLLDEAAKVWDWVVDSEIPEWMKFAVTGFATWRDVVDEQLAELDSLLRGIRARHPRGITAVQVISAVRGAVAAAKEVGIPLTAVQAEEIRALLEGAEFADWSAITTLEEELDRVTAAEPNTPAHAHAKVKAAVADRGAGLMTIRTFLETSEAWLNSALKAAALRTDGSGAQSATELQLVVSEWAELSGAREDGR